MSSEQRQFVHSTRSGLLRGTLGGARLFAAGAALAVLGLGGIVAMPEAAAAAPDCTPDAGQPNGKQWPAEPGMTIDPGANYTATLNTSCGAVTIALDAAKAPRTVNSFVFLANEAYFDHTRCHRLTTQGIFVLQCGDPTATGTGGPGYQVPDENLAGATYAAGTVAMANAGPNTNGSQFFLVTQDSQLPPNYTPFGKITAGMEKLTAVANGGTKDGTGDGAPAADMVIDSVAIAN
ncbi:peptidylprolyl isomerase [Nocardia goodfellowii]|uniref:Peptidyl-prolyl cis-trans isomerase n=1 Tax=Nocardia goodfellowii TaxID=882446 RepID=A0ABS4QGX7_9NOCA|nr:peptidylprolyl isomerase [Nocardia goodfellowii]MBP2190953.1 peptidyl-prolyl cis-trans isomerase B (cyclophilin B) [Nocardia goodfellowii]